MLETPRKEFYTVFTHSTNPKLRQYDVTWPQNQPNSLFQKFYFSYHKKIVLDLFLSSCWGWNTRKAVKLKEQRTSETWSVFEMAVNEFKKFVSYKNRSCLESRKNHS